MTQISLSKNLQDHRQDFTNSQPTIKPIAATGQALPKRGLNTQSSRDFRSIRETVEASIFGGICEDKS